MTEVKDIDWYTLAGVGIIGGLICIYAAVLLNAALGVSYFVFLGAVGAILATVWGADAVRKICKYGIGTGVPSIGMLAFGMGLLCTLLGLKVGDWLAAKYLTTTVIDNIKLGILVGPIVALVLSLVQGYIIGFIAQNILKMKIPTMQIGMTMISGAASLIYMGYTVTITGALRLQPDGQQRHQHWLHRAVVHGRSAPDAAPVQRVPRPRREPEEDSDSRR